MMGMLYSTKGAKNVSYSKNTTGVRFSGEKAQRRTEPVGKPLRPCRRELMELAREMADREGAASRPEV